MRLGICVHNIELNKAERPANSLKLRFSINDNVAFRTLCSIFHHMICTLYNIQICCYSVLFICMWLILLFSWYYPLHRALKKGKRLSLTFEDILKKLQSIWILEYCVCSAMWILYQHTSYQQLETILHLIKMMIIMFVSIMASESSILFVSFWAESATIQTWKKYMVISRLRGGTQAIFLFFKNTNKLLMLCSLFFFS